MIVAEIGPAETASIALDAKPHFFSLKLTMMTQAMPHDSSACWLYTAWMPFLEVRKNHPMGEHLIPTAISKTRQDQIEAMAYFSKISGVASVKFYCRCSFIAYIGESVVDVPPIDIAFSQGYPFRLSFSIAEILEVKFCNSLSHHSNPILRIAVEHHVADVEVSSQPWAFEVVYIAREIGGLTRNLFQTSSIAITTFNSSANGSSLRICHCDLVQASSK